jgi:DNA-binding MarR family transcriptional regulator
MKGLADVITSQTNTFFHDLQAAGADYRRMCERANSILRPLGLSPAKLNILGALTEHGDPVRSVADLAIQVGLHRTTVTSIVDGLDGAGLVERQPIESDRRCHAVVITDAGRRRYRDGLLALETAE